MTTTSEFKIETNKRINSLITTLKDENASSKSLAFLQDIFCRINDLGIGKPFTTPYAAVHILTYRHTDGIDAVPYFTAGEAVEAARELMYENIDQVLKPKELDRDGDNNVTFDSVDPNEWDELTGHSEFMDIHVSQIYGEDPTTPAGQEEILSALEHAIQFLDNDHKTTGSEGQHIKSKLEAVRSACLQVSQFKTTLQDIEGDETLDITIERNELGQIQIMPKGYGNCNMNDGEGTPLYLEYYEGKLKLYYFDDINDENNKSISLDGAKETNRKDD